MAALKPPFRAEDMEGLYKKVIRGKLIIMRIFRFIYKTPIIIFI